MSVCRRQLLPNFAANAANLRLPTALYQLRKRSRGSAAVLRQLSAVSQALFAGDAQKARVLLKKTQGLASSAGARH